MGSEPRRLRRAPHRFAPKLPTPQLTEAPQSTWLVALADRVEFWPMERLRIRAQPAHPREAQVPISLRAWSSSAGTNPILIDEHAGILAGHGRLLAARKLGLHEVPVVRFEHPARPEVGIPDRGQPAGPAGGLERGAAGRGAGVAQGRELRSRRCSASMPPSWSGSWRSRTATPGQMPRTRSRSPRERSASRATSGCSATHRAAVRPRTARTDVELVLGGQLADMTWTDPPYNVDPPTRRRTSRAEGPPDYDDNLGGGFEEYLHDRCATPAATKGACYICRVCSSDELMQT